METSLWKYGARHEVSLPPIFLLLALYSTIDEYRVVQAAKLKKLLLDIRPELLEVRNLILDLVPCKKQQTRPR